MRIAARMALQAPSDHIRDEGKAFAIPATTMRALGYHGIDVVVTAISEQGFIARCGERYRADAMVRLKLPGVGSVYAKLLWSRRGQVCGRFITPIAGPRLQRTLGIEAEPAITPALQAALA